MATNASRTGTILLALLLFSLSLSGCLAGPDTNPDPNRSATTNTTDPGLTLAPIQTPLTCEGSCYEPTVAAGPNGTLYVTHDSTIATQPPGATNWTTHPVPPIPPAARDTAYRGDETVHASPDGSLWYTALILERANVPAGVIMHGTGIQVAVSHDQGQTWATNQLVAPQQAPTWGADRQWLTFTPDGTAYLTAKATIWTGAYTAAGPVTGTQAGHSDLWATKSTDNGETWTQWTQATDTQAPTYGLIGGPPTLLDAETLVVPYFLGGLHAARSTDGAQTWTNTTVWTGEDGSAGDYFPIPATDPQGTIHLAWTGPNDHVHYANSTDQGQTWTDPQTVSPPPANTTLVSPWIEATDTGVAIEWLTQPTNQTVHLVHTQLNTQTLATEEPPQPDTVATTPTYTDTNPAATDFAHFDTLPDGSFVTVWNNPQEGQVHLRTIHPTPADP